MSDIRRLDDNIGMDRADAMKTLRKAMRDKNDCLSESAHCDNARKAIIDSMRSVMKLDPDYFKHFFKNHQEFAKNFSDYKYVEELCSVICAAEGWVTRPGEITPDAADPYGHIGWIGGLNLHLHASLYFGFSKRELLRTFQILQVMRELQVDEMALDTMDTSRIELSDSEDWMLYYVAALAIKFKPGVRHMETRRAEFGISDALRDDILGAVRSTYWWRYMMMSRAIDEAAEGLPPGVLKEDWPATGMPANPGGEPAPH